MGSIWPLCRFPPLHLVTFGNQPVDRRERGTVRSGRDSRTAENKGTAGRETYCTAADTTRGRWTLLVVPPRRWRCWTLAYFFFFLSPVELVYFKSRAILRVSILILFSDSSKCQPEHRVYEEHCNVDLMPHIKQNLWVLPFRYCPSSTIACIVHSARDVLSFCSLKSGSCFSSPLSISFHHSERKSWSSCARLRWAWHGGGFAS